MEHLGLIAMYCLGGSCIAYAVTQILQLSVVV